MKYVLISAILFFAMPSFAQKLEIGLNGGLGFNTAPIITADNIIAGGNEKSSAISPVASIKAMWNHNKWQYGVEAGYRQLSYKYSYQSGFLVLGNGGYLEPSNNYSSVFISKAAMPFKVFVNRKVTLGRFETYAGISAGYILATGCEDLAALAPQYFDHVNGDGLSVGLQLGTTYFITKRFGINAEVGGDYMIITIGDANYKLVAVPATVGVRYKI